MQNVRLKPYSTALTTLFADLNGQAQAGVPVFAGSPGNISKRKNQQDVEFWVRRFYGDRDVQQEEYLGKVGEADDAAKAEQEKIDEIKALRSDVQLLIRSGYQACDTKTYVTLVALHRNGLFAAGATLVGSHAFGVLLNQLGFAGAAYKTMDVDVARREALAINAPSKTFIDMLRESGIEFVEVPKLDSRKPSSSFKERGKSRFRVDLLVPSPDSEIHTVPVPELQAHATALPYMAYLLGQTQMSMVLYREGICPVRVPLPERFAIHKLVVSRLRTNRATESEKDVQQASVLLAALGQTFPGEIAKAVSELPVSARSHLKTAASLVAPRLEEFPRALEEFSEAVEATLLQ